MSRSTTRLAFTAILRVTLCIARRKTKSGFVFFFVFRWIFFHGSIDTFLARWLFWHVSQYSQQPHKLIDYYKLDQILQFFHRIPQRRRELDRGSTISFPPIKNGHRNRELQMIRASMIHFNKSKHTTPMHATTYIQIL